MRALGFVVTTAELNVILSKFLIESNDEFE